MYGNEALRSALRYHFEEAGPVSLQFNDDDHTPLKQAVLIFDHYLKGLNFNREDSAQVKNVSLVVVHLLFTVVIFIVT